MQMNSDWSAGVVVLAGNVTYGRMNRWSGPLYKRPHLHEDSLVW